MRRLLVIIILFYAAHVGSQTTNYSHADSLKGNYSKARAWWDVTHYSLDVDYTHYLDSSISGSNSITFKVLEPKTRLQIDLRQPMVIDSILYENTSLPFTRDGNAWFVEFKKPAQKNSLQKIKVFFHGKPTVAKNPPWDGGIIWSKDKNADPWISIACQGMSASVWFPCKDHMADEPDSAKMVYTCLKDFTAVGNGRFKGINVTDKGFTYSWEVKNSINIYNIIPYIGKYVNIKDTVLGKNGVLDLDYWVLNHNYEKAKVHFKQVKSMLHCFEDWLGAYPFYEDGYKLVEAPFLGMEHQSAIAYGNNFVTGYKGRDLSGTGWGLKWDFIIVHESGHEWFGNNISAKDVADNWIHESFTAYSENLYVEYLFGKKAGEEYVVGTRKEVLNDKPIIADYNVNMGGSGDLYYKGANMLHSMRLVVNNDSIWKEMLRGLSKKFWHQTVTTEEIEDFMKVFLKYDFQKVFDQYLRTTKIPVLEYRIVKGKLMYRWNNCVEKFNMPLRIDNGGKQQVIHPKQKWQKMPFVGTEFAVPVGYYIKVEKVN
ncbi:MAG: M1 family metallopeptidase [Bacteroidia bacterium]|nr:M1 family metallopeptidase [Bacteroidia bacterium]